MLTSIIHSVLPSEKTKGKVKGNPNKEEEKDNYRQPKASKIGEDGLEL